MRHTPFHPFYRWTIVLLATLAGCRSQDTRPRAPTVAPEAGEPVMRRLAHKEHALFADGVQVVARLQRLRTGAGTVDADTDYEALFDELAQQQLVRSSWQSDSQMRLTRGRLAYMMAGVMQIRAGLLTSLLGHTERYCLRELSHRELMHGGAASAWVSGSELVSVATRVADALSQNQDQLQLEHY